MTMVRVLNTVSLTLLIGMLAVVPAALVGRYLPVIFDTGIKEIAVAAWLAALASWFLARTVVKKEQEAAHESRSSGGSNKGVMIAVLLLAIAAGIAVVLHFYGTAWLPW